MYSRKLRKTSANLRVSAGRRKVASGARAISRPSRPWRAPPGLECLLLGLRQLRIEQFRVERNAYGKFVAHERQVLDDAEIRTLDDGRRVETRGLRLDHAGDFEDADLVDRGIQRDRLGDAVHGEVAGHFEAVLATLFNPGALEGDCRILGGIEEIRAFQLLIELLDPRVQSGQW